MVDPPGDELDKKVCRAITGENKTPAPRYSTSPKTARRLLATLAEMSFDVTFEESGSTSYCARSLRQERMASGSGETRELALARAVVHCTAWGPAPPPASRPRTFQSPAKPKSTRQTLACADCGQEIMAQRNPKVKPLCTRCSWSRLTAERERGIRRAVAAAHDKDVRPPEASRAASPIFRNPEKMPA